MFKISELQVESRPFVESEMNLWGTLEDSFIERVRELLGGKIGTVIEVGSYLGASAVKWAGVADRVICIDTWLGSIEHYGGIPRKPNGAPDVYDTFLSNMVHCGVANKVEVINLPASIAAGYLLQHRIDPDVVYLDGDHSYAGLTSDINSFSILAWHGGKLLTGDDYGQFGDVKAVVDDNFGGDVEIHKRYWIKQL